MGDIRNTFSSLVSYTCLKKYAVCIYITMFQKKKKGRKKERERKEKKKGGKEKENEQNLKEEMVTLGK